MSQQVLLKNKGLFSFPSHLSSVPEGAMLVARNIRIDRDGIVESRRGYAIYGSAMGSSATSTAHQLLNYKNRLLRHWGSGSGQFLEADNGSGTFNLFDLVLTGDTHSNTTIDNLSSTSQLEAGMPVSGTGIPNNTVIASITNNTTIEISNAATATTVGVSLTFTFNVQEVTQGLRIKGLEQNGNFYFTTSEGIKKISVANASDLATASITQSGMVKALDLQLTINAAPGFLEPNTVVAYRLVWGIKDANTNLILGAPSSREIIRETTGVAKTVDVRFIIPHGITTAHFYQLYRTATFADPSGDQDPGDEQRLVYENNPLSADLNNGFVTFTDVTPEDLRGANLYTNADSGEGILQSNNPPPFASDISSFKGYTFFSNTSTKQVLSLALLGTASLVSNVSTITVTDGTNSTTYTFRTAPGGEDAATQHVLLENSTGTPSLDVEATAKSLVRVINSQENEIIYAYYTSGVAELPGAMIFEARGLNQTQFYLTVNDAATTGIEFNPKIPVNGTVPPTNTVVSSNEVFPNRVYYSKFQQPEAIPALNYIDVGPKDKQINRILALRDSLFILKEEGVYRLSGLTAPFQVAPFDFSTIIEAPDSAVVLNNLIYMLSNQGVATISDTGVAIISRPIEDNLIKLLTPQYTNFVSATFGISYESDRAYYLFTVAQTSDTFATQCFRFNTFTQTWTLFDITKRCGIVNNADDKLYLGATDTNFLEQERKLFDRSDYADRQITLVLAANSINDTEIMLPSSQNISVDDVLVQIQYLTINQFNKLLTKLDKDSLLADSDYVSSLTAVSGVTLSSSLDLLIAKIRDDSGRQAVAGHTADASYTALIGTGSASFTALQTAFNALIAILNADTGLGYQNYVLSSGTISYELPILDITTQTNTITTDYDYPLLAGDVIIYNHIETELQYVPQFLTDTSITKQASEGTYIFEDSNFSEATVSYSSDLSADFESIVIPGLGNGTFGNIVYGNGLFGGNGSGIPFRTYVPRAKQRCRFLNCKFEHKRAREIFSLYGLSLTFNPVSQRGYR